jgi:hypothetical protein
MLCVFAPLRLGVEFGMPRTAFNAKAQRRKGAEKTCNFQPATCNFLFGTSSLVAASVALCLCLALRQLISIFCFPNFCFYPRAFALNSDGIFPT